MMQCCSKTHRRAKTLVFFLVVTLGIGAAGKRAFAETSGEYDQIIQKLAAKYDVEPALVKAVIRAESQFDPDAVSPKGARGLMQLMPRIARKHGVADPHDPWQNIRGGVRMLRGLLDRFDDDPRLALAAYNAGGGTVERYRGLPPFRETRDYVAKVLRFRARYRSEQGKEEVRDDPPARPRSSDDPPSRRRPSKDPPAQIRLVRDAWPRGAETIWYGAPQAANDSFQAVFHSPLPNAGPGGRPAPQVP